MKKSDVCQADPIPDDFPLWDGELYIVDGEKRVLHRTYLTVAQYKAMTGAVTVRKPTLEERITG